MKIAFFLDTAKVLGGAGNLLLQQAKLMAELHDVIVVFPTDKKGNYNCEYVERCRIAGVSHVCLKYSTAFNFIDIDYTGAMESAVEIEEFARKEKVSLFHSVQLNIAVEYVSRKLKIPHLMNIYSLQKDEFKICPADIYARYHLCDSKFYSAIWSQQLGITSKCIRPVALRNDIKKKSAYLRDKIKILMLGSVCEHKNQMEAIRAIEQCQDSCNLELHIAGDTGFSYSEECISYVIQHKLEKRIIFHNFVSNIVPLLEECDCLLCSSIVESFPSSMVEALSYDMTIISTPVAGVPELFIDKYNSFISKDFSASSIKESIVECLSYYASGEIAKIHDNAINTWKANFDRKIVKQQIDSYYKNILSDKNFKSVDVFFDMQENIRQTEMLLKDVTAADDEEWVYTRSLYYTFLRKKLGKEEVYIWGAGKMGRLTLNVLKNVFTDLTVKAFIDTHREGTYCDVPIIRPQDVPIKKQTLYFISFAQHKNDAICYLTERGLELNTQVWCMP